MKKLRLAKLTRDVGGQFTNFRKGEYVWAIHVRGSSYLIERLKWKGAKVPLCNQCTGIPRSALFFDLLRPVEKS